MSEPITAIVLAGGQGTRLRSVVPDLPKPMAAVAGRPFLEHLLDYWIAQGVSRFILSVGYRREVIMTHFGAHYRGIPIDYSVEEQALGTGGGLLLATRSLKDEKAFLLLNGDTYFAVSLPALVDFAKIRAGAWCLALFQTEDTDRYMGLDSDAHGNIHDLGRKTSGSAILANGGVYWVSTEHLKQLGFPIGQECSLEADILPKAMATGQKILGHACPGTFVDIGVPHDYRRAQTLLQNASPAAESNQN